MRLFPHLMLLSGALALGAGTSPVGNPPAGLPPAPPAWTAAEAAAGATPTAPAGAGAGTLPVSAGAQDTAKSAAPVRAASPSPANAPAPSSSALPAAPDSGAAASGSPAPGPAAVSTSPESSRSSSNGPAATLTASAPAMSQAADHAADSIRTADSAAALASPGLLEIRNPVLDRLALSGTVQLKAFYRDFASESDSDKRLTLQLRRFKLGLEGFVTDRVGFKGEFLMDGANRNFGTDDAFLWWKPSAHVGFKGGKIKRPFSQEALHSSKSLYTVERGELYHDFLANTTGYAYYDLGLSAAGGFEDDGVEAGYELGVFNGKQGQDGYANQQDEKTDAGFLAKDVAGRLWVSPIRPLKLEAAFSTKAAEDRSNAADFVFAVNTAYEFGLELALGRLRLLGEVALGDNHRGSDSLIIAGSADFFAFYAMGVWREEYRRGRASELVLKLEGLDPDYGWKEGEGRPNDGKLRYTAGCNYFFSPAVSMMANYGLLQPITEVPGQGRLIHSFDALWRLAF